MYSLISEYKIPPKNELRIPKKTYSNVMNLKKKEEQNVYVSVLEGTTRKWRKYKVK